MSTVLCVSVDNQRTSSFIACYADRSWDAPAYSHLPYHRDFTVLLLPSDTTKVVVHRVHCTRRLLRPNATRQCSELQQVHTALVSPLPAHQCNEAILRPVPTVSKEHNAPAPCFQPERGTEGHSVGGVSAAPPSCQIAATGFTRISVPPPQSSSRTCALFNSSVGSLPTARTWLCTWALTTCSRCTDAQQQLQCTSSSGATV